MPTYSPEWEDEYDLIHRILQRDKQGMAVLYARFRCLVYFIVKREARDVFIAEDLVQETFWRIWNCMHTFDFDKGKLAPWIATIARNRAIDHRRSFRRVKELSLETVPESRMPTSAQVHTNRLDQQDLLYQAMNCLSHTQREIVELTIQQGLTHNEISVRLCRPLGTVKSTYRSAKKRLVVEVSALEGKRGSQLLQAL
jgi:RNA polymerase sigma-70 factor (ECF subfamily)